MTNENRTELQEKVEVILMLNMAFYRESPGDKKSYFVELASVVELAYEILQFLAMGFGVIQGVDWLLKRRKIKGEDEIEIIEREKPLCRISELKEDLTKEEKRGQLERDISGILKFHGWPEKEAERDAQKIIGGLLE